MIIFQICSNSKGSKQARAGEIHGELSPNSSLAEVISDVKRALMIRKLWLPPQSLFFLPACPFYLPSQSRWVALVGLYTHPGRSMPAAESAPAGYTQALVKLAKTQLRSAANLGSMRDLKEKQSADQFLTLPFSE